MFEIKVMGVGGAYCNHPITNTNAIIRADKNQYLIDCGQTISSVAHKYLNLSRLRGIFITHTHGDHIGGLEWLAYRLKFSFHEDEEIERRKVKVYASENVMPDLIEIMDTIGKVCGVKDIFDSVFDYEIIKNSKMLHLDDFSVSPFSVEHVKDKPASGFAFCHVDHTVSEITEIAIWSGDTKKGVFDIDILKEHDSIPVTVFHDCALVPNPNHVYIDDLEPPIDREDLRVYLIHYDWGLDDGSLKYDKTILRHSMFRKKLKFARAGEGYHFGKTGLTF